MKRILTWILALVLAACCVPAMAEECSHDWNVKEPTCAKNGIKLCKICGATEVLPATGAHTMVVTIEPTCKDEGEKMCSVCGLRESIAKTENHNWKTVEPTCGKDGAKLCILCGKGEKLPATGEHTMKVTKEPTCKEEGEKTCSVCGHTEKIAKTENHTWKISEPTCAKEGVKLCTVCGYSEKIAKTENHTWKISEPTCAKEGVKLCTVCGYSEKIAKTENHTWKIVEPTCGEDGMKLCTVCSATEILPATGEHTMEVTKEPMCKDEGEKTCSVCGYSEPIAKTENHVWETVEEPCVKDGKKRCTVCGKEESLPATGEHDWVIGKEPTCTEAGDRVCVACGADEVLPATGHKVVVIPAVTETCTKEGSTEGEFCETCGEMIKEPQKIPAKNHDYYCKVVEPTADKSGYTLHTCRYCGRQYSSDRVEALGQGNDRIYGIVTDVNRVVKDYTLNTASEVAVINAAAEEDGTFATRCLFLSEETVQKLADAGCSEVRFTVGNASVSFPLNALGSETVVITLSMEDDGIGVKATIDDEGAQDVTEKLEGLTLTIANAKNTKLATESGRAYDATLENGVWTIKVPAAETYILTAAK